MDVACGQCLGCRLDWAFVWAMRIVHESVLHELDRGNSFITLTYRDPIECELDEWLKGYHVPNDWSLHKSHWQKFMKRLRRHFEPHKIRFFAAGEYGKKCKHGIELDKVDCPMCNVGRPHWHACLFNCSFDDLEPYFSDGAITRYTSPTLASIWKYGFVDVNELNFDTAAYVARYCLKKITGVMADSHYMQIDLDGVATWVQPEVVYMSRNPGIGSEWFRKYYTDVFPSDEVPVPGQGIVQKVPRYYQEIFEEVFPLELEEIKAIRQAWIREHGEDYTPERLMDRYKVRKARMKLQKPRE
jgi:hypothetical protein